MPGNPLSNPEILNYAQFSAQQNLGYLNLPQAYVYATPHNQSGPAAYRLFDAAYISTGIIDPNRLGTGATGAGNLYLADDGQWKPVAGGGGGGDMYKATYDTDNSGIVDKAEALATLGRNSTGATLYEGTIVRIEGSTGNRPNFVKAQGNNDANSAQTFGVVMTDIANNSDGYVLVQGTLHDLDTRTGANGAIHPFTDVTLADGDLLYLHPTIPGYVTNIKPSAPQHLVYVGVVTRTSPTNGTIVYRIQNGYELYELHDVAPTPYINNGVLYRDTTDNLWKSATIATLLGGTPLLAVPTLAQVTTAGNTTNNSIIFSSTTASNNAIINQTNTQNLIFGMAGTVVNGAYYQVFGTNWATATQRGGAEFVIDTRNSGTGGFTLFTYDGSGWTNRFKMYVSGNIGIGTTTDAGYKLDVNGTARVQSTALITYNDNSYLPGISITNTNSGVSALSGVSFTVNGVMGGFMSYIPSNYILPAQASTMQFTSTGNNKLGFIANSNQVGVAQDIYFSTFGSNTTYQMQIKGSTGNIQIGTNTDAGYKLDVNGSTRFKGDGWFDSNDAGQSVLRVGSNTNVYFRVNSLGSVSARDFATNAGNTSLLSDGTVRIASTLSSASALTIGEYTSGGNFLVFRGAFTTPFMYWSQAGLQYGNNASAVASALVEFNSTTKGFLQPRMTNAQAVAIATPATGLQVYDTTNNKNLLYNGTVWQNIATESWVTAQGYLTSAPTPTLDQVTTAGNTASGDIYINGVRIGRGGTQIQDTNTVVGRNALGGTAGSGHNTAIGNEAFFSWTIGLDNTGVGSQALYSLANGSRNVAVGRSALRGVVGGNNNIGIGDRALTLAAGSNNVAIGSYTGYGNGAGAGSGNVFLGYQAGYNETGSNTLYIANSLSNTIIYGNFATGNVSIGSTTDAGYKLYINGAVKSTGRNQASYFDSIDENPSFLLWKSDYSQVWGGFSTRSAAGGAGIGVYDPTIQASSGLGIYFLVNATTTAAFINSSGNFGIGTVSPSTKLHVNGVITATGGTSTDWNTAYSWGNHATAGYLTSVSDVWVNTTGDTMTGQLVISTTGTGGSPTLRINTSTASAYVHSQENIAANLTSGQRNILVVGQGTSTKNSGYFGYYWAGAGSDSNFITIGHWGNNDLFRIYGNGNANFQGNLSIGASTTTTNFEVIGGDAEVIVHAPGNSRGGLRALGGQLVGFMTTASSDDLVFGWENGYKGAFTERMRIDNGTGNVLINTTTDVGYKLDVNGSFRAAGNSYLATAANTTVGIGVTTALSKLHVQGADGLLLLQGSGASGFYFPTQVIRGGYPRIILQSEDGTVTFGGLFSTQETSGNPWGNLSISSRTAMLFLVQAYSGSAPVFSFDSNGNTTVTNQLTVGGGLIVDTNTLFVDATNNRVGIGTTSPNKALTVYGGNDNGIWIDSNGNQYTTLALGRSGIEKANFAWDNTNSRLGIVTYGASSMTFSPNSAEAMRIANGGNVLIGTITDTGYKLNVNGMVYSTRYELAQGSDLASGVAGIRVLDNFGGMYQYNNSGPYTGHFTSYHIRDTSATTMFYATSSHFGIGTLTPLYRLHVSGGNVMINNGSGANIYGFDEYHYIKLRDGGTDWVTLGDYGGIRFFTGNNSTTLTEKVQIAPNGNLGIGTISPTQGKLVIAAPDESTASAISIRQSNAMNFGMDIGLDQTVNGNGYFYSVSGDSKYEFLQFSRTTVPNVFLVGSGGNVGVGTTSPSQQLHVTGKVLIGAVDNFGDANTKLYIHSPTNAVNIVLNPRPTAGDIYYRVKLGVDVSSTSSFYVEHEGIGRIIEAWNSGGYLNLSSVVSLGNKAWTLETNGQGLQMYSPYAWSSVVRYTNAATGTTATDGALTGITENGDFRVWTYESHPMLFATANVERLRITSTGNVGIGTSSPSYKLDVSGDIRATTDIIANGNLKSLYQSGDEGGEITLNKPVTNTTLTTGVTIDVYQDKLRIFESGGTNRGGFFDLSALAAAVGTNFEPVGYTGILTIPGNPPGQQNVDIQNGRIVNVF